MNRRVFPRFVSILLWCVLWFSLFTGSGAYGLLMLAARMDALR